MSNRLLRPETETAPPPATPPSAPRAAWQAVTAQWQRVPPRARPVVGQVALTVLVVLLVLPLASLIGLTGGRAAPAPNTTSVPTTGTAQVPPHTTFDARLPATQPGDTVNVKLVAKETTLAIAPDVAYQAWTFNGTVPGPVIRVRQGQTVVFTLTNDGKMPHSIDFHAAQTPWNVNYQPVAPGKTLTFTWKAEVPGVFMYHCGTPPPMVHISNGMYGAIIVDPAGGWAPAQEYALVQSEFYARKLPDGTYGLDGTAMMNTQPTQVVFNGYANQYKDSPLTARAGQKIRLFVVNAGPSEFSAFHVIGAIFSDAYADGNPANRTVGNQTITIPPGGGAVVELTIPEAGLYPFLTHSFAGADKGAVGVLKVTP